MSLLLGALVPLHAQVAGGLAVTGDELYCYVDSKKFTYQVTKAMLDRTPNWDPASDLPYPIAKARAQAIAEIGKLLPNAKDFTLSTISIEYQRAWDKWYYQIIFDNVKDAKVGLPPILPFSVIILFDGTVVEPTITKSDLPF